jgi:hypothetical protein
MIVIKASWMMASKRPDYMSYAGYIDYADYIDYTGYTGSRAELCI